MHKGDASTWWFGTKYLVWHGLRLFSYCVVHSFDRRMLYFTSHVKLQNPNQIVFISLYYCFHLHKYISFEPLIEINTDKINVFPVPIGK